MSTSVLLSLLPEDDEAAAESRRTARRERRIKRQLRLVREGELNIVSLIDVFAVLVFFLLVTASITAARLNVLALDLPGKAAAASAAPLARPSITVLDDALLVDTGDGVARRYPRTADGRALAALPALLLTAKRRLPKQDAIDLLVGPDIAYADVVAVIDAMRATTPAAVSAGFTGELFPRLAIGDAAGNGLGSAAR